jgi:hypothetical protein
MKDMLKQLLVWFVQGIIGALILAFMLFMVLEWASGCGETYVDSKGVTHVGECVITINTPTIRK